MKGRNYTIDLLRFIASSWVVLFHLNEVADTIQNPYRSFAKQGWLGVPIFFVVSGYCIGLATQHSKNAVDFFTRRLFRIFPAYWLSLFVVIFCVGFQILTFGQNSVTVLPKSVTSIIATLLLLTSPLSSTATINWVYWSLTFELFFYIVIALSLFLRSGYRCVFFLFISLLSFLPYAQNIFGLFFLQHWPTFSVGLSLYLIKSNDKNKILPYLLLVSNVIYLLYSNHPTTYLLTSLITFAIIAYSLYIKDLPANFFSRLGDFSYAVYLIHVPLGVYLIGIYKTPLIHKYIVYNIIWDAGVLSLVIFLSKFIYLYLELPCIETGKKFAKKFLKRQAPALVLPV